MVESLQRLMSIESDIHWAGRPDEKIVLSDAFRTLVREGELQLITPCVACAWEGL